ncbi:TPA: hypothetical protein ACH3X1_000680 [Trebouxia sp. C0004]
MQTVLAEMDADEGPLSSSAAAAASQSDQSVQVLFWSPPTAAAASASPAAAVTPAPPAVKASAPDPGSTAGAVPADSTGNGIPSMHLTVTRASAKPVSGSVATATKAVARAWKSCRSFAELGCGSSLVLDVQDQAHQQPVADAGPAQQPDAASQGHANQLGHCVQL